MPKPEVEVRLVRTQEFEAINGQVLWKEPEEHELPPLVPKPPLHHIDEEDYQRVFKHVLDTLLAENGGPYAVARRFAENAVNEWVGDINRRCDQAVLDWLQATGREGG